MFFQPKLSMFCMNIMAFMNVQCLEFQTKNGARLWPRFVVLKPGASVTDVDLMAHVKQKLASYKVPRAIEFVSELPKTGSGKIYKKGFRDKHWSVSGRQVN